MAVGDIAEAARRGRNGGRGSRHQSGGGVALPPACKRREAQQETEKREHHEYPGQPHVREAEHGGHGAIGVAPEIVAAAAVAHHQFAAAHGSALLVRQAIGQGGALAQHGRPDKRPVGAHSVGRDVLHRLHLHGQQQRLIEVAPHEGLSGAVTVQTGDNGGDHQHKTRRKDQSSHLIAFGTKIRENYET